MSDSTRPTTVAEVVARVWRCLEQEDGWEELDAADVALLAESVADLSTAQGRALQAEHEFTQVRRELESTTAQMEDYRGRMQTAERHAAQLVELNMALEAKATATEEQRDAILARNRELAAMLNPLIRAEMDFAVLRTERDAALERVTALEEKCILLSASERKAHAERDELRAENERLMEALQILSVVDDPSRCFQEPTLRGIAKIAKDALTPRDPAASRINLKDPAAQGVTEAERAAVLKRVFESGAGSTDGRAEPVSPQDLGRAAGSETPQPKLVPGAGTQPGPAPDSPALGPFLCPHNLAWRSCVLCLREHPAWEIGMRNAAEIADQEQSCWCASRIRQELDAPSTPAHEAGKALDALAAEYWRDVNDRVSYEVRVNARAILSRLVQAVREECAQACEPPSEMQWEWFAGQVEARFEWQWGEDACSSGLGGLQLAAALIRALASKTSGEA